MESLGSNYEAYSFIPDYVGTLKPGEDLNFKAPCFSSSDFSFRANSDGAYTLHFDL